MLSGVLGYIRWGHYTAAAIERYTVTPTSKARTVWTLTGMVTNGDAFKLAQSPLVFVAKHAKGEWCFPIVRMARTEYRLTATLGPPESTVKR